MSPRMLRDVIWPYESMGCAAVPGLPGIPGRGTEGRGGGNTKVGSGVYRV